MRFVIVTGMSGAGKSTALKCLEDIGFFCVDNLPPVLIPKFIELCTDKSDEIDKIALGIDIRGGKLFEDFFAVIKENNQWEILFLDAETNVLVKRFKETRRNHPFFKEGSMTTGIEKEAELLKEIKKKAAYIIDTSNILTRELKEQINDIFLHNKKFESLMVTITSFGFKYGIPQESDMVFDVRFIPNPFYIPEMRELTGHDKAVMEFVMEREESKIFLHKLNDMVEFLIPHYIIEGKNKLVISIGCTGGKHRSVTLANEIYVRLKELGHNVTIIHQDIDKDAKRK